MKYEQESMHCDTIAPDNIGISNAGLLGSILKESFGRQACDSDHGPVPEEGRSGEAGRHGGHAQALEGRNDLRQVVQIAGGLPDGRPKVHLPWPRYGRHRQLHTPQSLSSTCGVAQQWPSLEARKPRTLLPLMTLYWQISQTPLTDSVSAPLGMRTSYTSKSMHRWHVSRGVKHRASHTAHILRGRSLSAHSR